MMYFELYLDVDQGYDDIYAEIEEACEETGYVSIDEVKEIVSNNLNHWDLEDILEESDIYRQIEKQICKELISELGDDDRLAESKRPNRKNRRRF